MLIILKFSLNKFIVLSVLSVFLYWLPSDTGEKITFCKSYLYNRILINYKYIFNYILIAVTLLLAFFFNSLIIK